MEPLLQGIAGAVGLVVGGDGELRRICLLSLAVSGSATALAAGVGVPAGVVLAAGSVPGRGALRAVINTGMALPPVVVGLGVLLLLWRTAPLGFLHLVYTPAAMVLAQLIVAAPLAAGLTASAVAALDQDLPDALRVDGASGARLGAELVRGALPQVVTAVAAAFGRAIAEVGASLMVGGNILGQTRILTTAVALEAGKGEFALALALGMVLVAVAFLVNVGLVTVPAALGMGRAIAIRPRWVAARGGQRGSAPKPRAWEMRWAVSTTARTWVSSGGRPVGT